MYSGKYGKTIRLFLMDADPDGRVVCELSNWNGKAYRVPRGKVKDCSDREDLRGTAVYLLFGHAESSASKPKVYIGEAENVYSRLTQQVAEKEFWNEAVLFTSKDQNLNKAHIKYLESRLYELACAAGRYQLLNSNTPTRSSISEADQAEMEEFIAYVKILVNTLGFKVFDPLNTSSGEVNDNFFIKSARGANARGKRSPDGFIVYADSKIALNTVPSFSANLKALREELIEGGVLVLTEDALSVSRDYLFSSPSTAASVVMGRNANGLIEWKDAEGRELKHVEAMEIAASSQQS